MRPLLLLALSGCLAGKLDANGKPGVISNPRPSVMPKLSELPTDREQRNGILNQSGERARPENRRSLSKREQKAETFAAIAAALIGDAYSSTKNVTIGIATDFEEGAFVDQPQTPAKRPAPVAPVKIVPASELVPWVKLGPKADDQKSKPADIDSVR